MNGLSPKFPLRFDYAGGAYALNKTYREMVKQNLKNLILFFRYKNKTRLKYRKALKHFKTEETGWHPTLKRNLKQ